MPPRPMCDRTLSLVVTAPANPVDADVVFVQWTDVANMMGRVVRVDDRDRVITMVGYTDKVVSLPGARTQGSIASRRHLGS